MKCVYNISKGNLNGVNSTIGVHIGERMREHKRLSIGVHIGERIREHKSMSLAM